MYSLIFNKSIKKQLLSILKILKIFFVIILFLILNFKIYTKALKNDDLNFLPFSRFTSDNPKSIHNNLINNNDFEFLQFQKMLPRLTPDLNKFPSSLKEIFDSRQLFITDNKITHKYINYIRPINETQEKKYKKRFSENITIVDTNIFKKKADQYNYIDFLNLAYNEKLIDKKNFKYANKPIISLILPSYNKQNILLKSIRSIQNQNFNNIEIIIVNDFSNDNSTIIFNYLLETDPRIRIFHHITNLGVFRSRLDGVLYSRGKYIIFFDPGDFYEDNYVLLDSYNVIEKYNLDSCKFLFRIIKNLNNLNRSSILHHVGAKAKIEYGAKNIKILNDNIFKTYGNIWNRLVRANIYIKGLLSLNELMLNVYKNMWDDIWYNEIVNKASYSYAIFERVGYVYYNDKKGEGTPKFETVEQKSRIIKEYISFLYFDYNFCANSICKSLIIQKLRSYNEKDQKIQLKNFRSHFEVLNNLLETLIKDPDLIDDDRKYCKKLLYESKVREKGINGINDDKYINQ